jgi:hypothetical protein
MGLNIDHTNPEDQILFTLLPPDLSVTGSMLPQWF